MTVYERPEKVGVFGGLKAGGPGLEREFFFLFGQRTEGGRLLAQSSQTEGAVVGYVCGREGS